MRAWLALGGRAGLERRPLFDTEGWVEDFQGCLLSMAELTGMQGGAAAGAVGAAPMHFVRAYQSRWGWRADAL